MMSWWSFIGPIFHDLGIAALMIYCILAVILCMMAFLVVLCNPHLDHLIVRDYKHGNDVDLERGRSSEYDPLLSEKTVTYNTDERSVKTENRKKKIKTVRISRKTLLSEDH